MTGRTSLLRRRLLGWGILGALALFGVMRIARLDFARAISTDVLDLIPAGEREPELALVRELASQAEAREMFFTLSEADGSPAPDAAAQRFAAELSRSPVFAEAVAMSDTTSNDALGRELFERRFTLLFPLWLREREAAYAATGGAPGGFTEWLAGDAEAGLGRFLSSPEALAMQESIPADPLLLLPGVLRRMGGGLAIAQPGASGGATLVWARLAVSPLREEGQAPAFSAIGRAVETVRAEFPGLAVAYTGVNCFAAASRARIEREVSWLNALSIAAVLAVALTFIRSVHRALHLVPVVLLSVLGAWVCVTAVFEHVHILVFVVGSLLTGVSIDYGFYLYLQPPARADEDYWEKVRRLLKPLLASCLTAVAGFALLLFSELPMIRQLGVFVGSGLVCALAAAILYFSTVEPPYLETRSFRGGELLSSGARRLLRRLLVVGWCVALPGLARLTWRDDVRDLEIPSATLQSEDARIRALFGDRGDRTAYLTYGSSIDEARASLDRFDHWLRVGGTPGAAVVNLGALVPTAAEHAHAIQFVREHPEFPALLRGALAAGGYDVSAFSGFFGAFARYAGSAQEADLDLAVRELQRDIKGPPALLIHVGQPLSWYVTIANAAPGALPPSDLHTVGTDQLQSLNRLFAHYRQSALLLSIVGLGIVGGGVLLTYGLRDGARIFAIPCGACLGLFGVLGWVGEPLNLFHLLGAFLGVCLTHNYSIFTATSAYRREPPPVSVRLSALTATASFGVLGLSGIPVVRALGTTVASMVLVALLLIEIEHLSPLAKKS